MFDNSMYTVQCTVCSKKKIQSTPVECFLVKKSQTSRLKKTVTLSQYSHLFASQRDSVTRFFRPSCSQKKLYLLINRLEQFVKRISDKVCTTRPSYQKKNFFTACRGLGVLLLYCTVLTVRSAAPQTTPWGGNGPRLENGQGGQAGALTTRPHTSSPYFKTWIMKRLVRNNAHPRFCLTIKSSKDDLLRQRSPYRASVVLDYADIFSCKYLGCIPVWSGYKRSTQCFVRSKIQ